MEKLFGKSKRLKKYCYITVKPFLNTTKKPAEVRMGKGKGKFFEKIAILPTGFCIFEFRITPIYTSIEDWSKLNGLFINEVTNLVNKLRSKLPFGLKISFGDI